MAAVLHASRRLGQDVEDAARVDVEHIVEVGGRGVGQRLENAHARVGDDDVRLGTERLLGLGPAPAASDPRPRSQPSPPYLIKQPDDLLVHRDVGLDGHGLAASADDLLDDLVRLVLGLDVVDGHGRAVAAEAQRDAAADAA